MHVGHMEVYTLASSFHVTGSFTFSFVRIDIW